MESGIGSASGYANLKLVGNGSPGIKFVDEGNGAKEDDFIIALNGLSELEIGNANNASDDFETYDLIAKFETLDDPYQFVVYGTALASGGMFTNSDRRLKKDIKDLDNAFGLTFIDSNQKNTNMIIKTGHIND